MEGLRYLRVDLKVDGRYWRNIDTELEEHLLEPIMSVQVRDDFDLIIPFTGNSYGEAWSALPCRIERTCIGYSWN